MDYRVGGSLVVYGGELERSYCIGILTAERLGRLVLAFPCFYHLCMGGLG